MIAAPAGTHTRRRGRVVATWAAIAVALVALGAAVGAISTSPGASSRAVLDPEGTAPDGARAIARILADQGVDVRVARTLDDAHAALEDAQATLALADTGILDDPALTALTGTATTTVLLQPRTRDLRVLFDGAAPAGRADELIAPECAIAAAQRAGDVAPGALYRPGPNAVTCYPAGDGWGLLSSPDGSTVAVDAAALMTNATLADDGNAALMLNLLGAHEVLVWYLPGPGDGAGGGAATLGELTPGWVTPAIALLAAAAVAAAVWRGRRFGPLVAETLPVTVRAAETTEGRARLYARADDTVHAAARLRAGATRRLAQRMGMSPATEADDVADTLAARIRADPHAVRATLAGDPPHDDRGLLALADALRDLDVAVERARPERNA